MPQEANLRRASSLVLRAKLDLSNGQSGQPLLRVLTKGGKRIKGTLPPGTKDTEQVTLKHLDLSIDGAANPGLLKNIFARTMVA